ncbi:uncharacterized protein BCR38DRAFT_163706 [Pseudomassariella vexata]|uniref:Secreted protein n=1 Tax=Pseudomassariella vexata TaxID=1141098 RepID=A0A1Y2E862_9PEZI|nr:uncharacterized protein BCR38DRAFT_163706 [Pseudomassariella vexata]ORY67729.1 hypothetical protein BCR38DRAFT_163706 [Pseudomassariella vexata]
MLEVKLVLALFVFSSKLGPLLIRADLYFIGHIIPFDLLLFRHHLRGYLTDARIEWKMKLHMGPRLLGSPVAWPSRFLIRIDWQLHGHVKVLIHIYIFPWGPSSLLPCA